MNIPHNITPVMNSQFPIIPPAPSSSPFSVGSRKALEYFPEGYAPGAWDVICQRGKDCHEHVGNRRFRMCVESFVDSYVNSRTRQEKSAIISNIVKMVHENATGNMGGFVMKDTKNLRWHHVDNKVARDKVGNALRDAVKQRQEGNAATCPAESNIMDHQRDTGLDWMKGPIHPLGSTPMAGGNAPLPTRQNSSLESQFGQQMIPTALDIVGSSFEIQTPQQIHQHQFQPNLLLQEKTNGQVMMQLHQLKMAMSNNPSFMDPQQVGNGFQQHLTPLDRDCFSIDNLVSPQMNVLSSHHRTESRACHMHCLDTLDDSMDFDFEPRPIGDF